MPMPDQMGITLSPAEVQDIKDHFTAILTIINAKKVVQLTPKERQGAQSASEIRIPYIENAINNLAPAFPNLQPNFLTLADAQINLDSSMAFREMTGLRNEVNDRMIDFAMASEHFAYQYMRKFYNTAQQAQDINTPGADTVVEALSPLFEQEKSGSDPVPNP